VLSTIDRVRKWIDKIHSCNSPDSIILVLGNMLDKQANNQKAIDSLEEEIYKEFGNENIMFFPVSILCDFGVQEAIEKFGERL